MTDAEYFKNVIELQKERYHPATNTGCTNVLTSRLERAIKDLERLAAIDEVLRERVTAGMYQIETYPPEMDSASIRKVKQIHGGQLIDALIAQDLLPKAEVASDEDN